MPQIGIDGNPQYGYGLRPSLKSLRYAMASMLNALDERGLLAQISDRTGLDGHLAGGRRTVYAGFDPTASSLQIGNLVTLLMLRRFQLGGHRPVALVGGATGLIGDPSERVDERALNSLDAVRQWAAAIHDQVARFIDLDGPGAGMIVNNLDWTRDLDVISFLRDIGKHFSVKAMVQRDSVRLRLDRDGVGISYTEFSYMLLQAHDFLELARRHGCTVQLGGSDQWGNIVSGVDLARRVLRRQTYALTHPLITKQDGSKFGKSAAGAVWLDAQRTSPYAFHQFWLNTADADVVPFLRSFTLLDLAEIDAAGAAVARQPELREGQRLLADEATRLVHGEAALASARRIASALFDGEVRALGQDDIAQLERDGIANSAVAPGAGLLEAMVEAGLAASNGAARRLVHGGGVRVNGVAVDDAAMRLESAAALFGRYWMIRRGKRNWHLLVRADAA